MQTREDLAKSLYDLGREAHNKGRLAEAAELFRASAELYPHFKTLELLGESLVSMHQSREGVVYLAAAAGLAPKQSRPRLLLAQVLISWDEPDAARTQLREALRINPDYRPASELLKQLLGSGDEEL